MLIHPLTLSFDDKQLEASFLRDETSRLRVVDAYAIALHGITTIAAVLRDFQLVFNASSWQTATYNMATATRMIGANKNHFVGVVYIIFNLLCVSNPWLRWTPKRNTYLTAVRLALPLFHLFPIHATHEELSQSYFTGRQRMLVGNVVAQHYPPSTPRQLYAVCSANRHLPNFCGSALSRTRGNHGADAVCLVASMDAKFRHRCRLVRRFAAFCDHRPHMQQFLDFFPAHASPTGVAAVACA